MCFSSGQPDAPINTPSYKPDDIDKNISVSSETDKKPSAKRAEAPAMLGTQNPNIVM